MAIFSKSINPLAPPAQPVIRRTHVPCSLETASLEVAEEAHALLGYTGLSVVQVFKKLGIEPLNTDDVEDYKDKKDRRSAYCWHSEALEKYGKPIPEFALSRAIEIKRELPSAQFFIEELRYDPDPFLYIQVGNVRYYLDVWDEPKFEGRRTV